MCKRIISSKITDIYSEFGVTRYSHSGMYILKTVIYKVSKMSQNINTDGI